MKFKEFRNYFVEMIDGIYEFDKKKLDAMTILEKKEMFLPILEEYKKYNTDVDKDGTYIFVPVEDGEYTFYSWHNSTDELAEFTMNIWMILFVKDEDSK